jgi:hypothetical protein
MIQSSTLFFGNDSKFYPILSLWSVLQRECAKYINSIVVVIGCINIFVSLLYVYIGR